MFCLTLFVFCLKVLTLGSGLPRGETRLCPSTPGRQDRERPSFEEQFSLVLDEFMSCFFLGIDFSIFFEYLQK